MLDGKGRIKGLRPQRRRVFQKPTGIHETYSAQSADVTVMQRSAVAKPERDRGVAALVRVEVTVVNEEGASESGLDDNSVRVRQVNDDQLCSTPTLGDDRAGNSLGERTRRDLSQNVSAEDPHPVDDRSSDRRIEIASDRLRFRKLWHCARARASRCRAGIACRQTRLTSQRRS